jgi:hypothetical protein
MLGPDDEEDVKILNRFTTPQWESCWQMMGVPVPTVCLR